MPLNLEMKSELLRPECVMSHLERHGARRSELMSAIDGLASLPEINSIETASASFTSTADAICHGVKIFVSYKIGHGRAARALLEPFSLFGNGRILFDDSQKWPFLCELAGHAGPPLQGLGPRGARGDALVLPAAAGRGHRPGLGDVRGGVLPAFDAARRQADLHPPSIRHAGRTARRFRPGDATPEDLLRMYRTLLCEPGAIPGMDAINARLSDELPQASRHQPHRADPADAGTETALLCQFCRHQA